MSPPADRTDTANANIGRTIKVVGIGASAGGLDAFHAFFGSLPDDTGLAFVVILHLPADRRSLLPEILARWTSLRVVEAQDHQVLEADCVFVPPPHAIVALQAGRLRIRMPEADAPREFRPIDAFFDSLAASLRENAIGIVLSGTGTDGALGLKAIKGCGGLTLAQGSDGTVPQYDSMPAGAIATGAVDLVVPVQEMPGHLIRLRGVLRPPDDVAEQTPEHNEASRLEICRIIRARAGHNFSGYKDKTFLRRVQRRMQVLDLASIDNYVALLEHDHDEVMLLFRDLLIRVTSFFRDPETFHTLETEVMPRLFAGRHADSTVRVWVPGCATGEEAYSLAILLREHMDRLQAPPKVQLFGTDIDEPAIAIARLGRYPGTLLEELSEERRRRFFHSSPSGFVVSREIRDLCTFSPHSIVRDPPFSRMDMISCRNLLIYMDMELQAAVLPSFHYALAPGGILLLGSSESVARHEELFEALDKPARIYRRREVRGPPLDLRGAERRKLLAPSPSVTARPPDWLRRPMADPPAAEKQVPTPGSPAHRGLLGGVRMRLKQALGGSAVTDGLKQQLEFTREQLQAVTEEHQTALEELRSANEELHSVNEELQSTNEELETSQEELQSVNEELQTVNARLGEKIDELDRTNSDLRNLFESTQIATVFLDRHLIIRGFTPAVGSIYNLIPSDQGRPLTDIVSRLSYASLREDVGHVLDTLQPLERRVTCDDGRSHYLMRILPYWAPDGEVSGTLVTFLDVTTIVQAEQHQRLLVDELNHRVRNMLTVVISLAGQTLRRSPDLAAFSETFLGRVQSLTASYSLLSNENWVDVVLGDIVVEEMKPYVADDSRNVVMSGPAIRLAPSAALALGMAVHELATNAVKYGALSGPEGRVTISWREEGDTDQRSFVLDWVEQGGPPVQAPERRGFGTTLIERGFAHELSGQAKVEFATEGVRASLRAPLPSALGLKKSA